MDNQVYVTDIAGLHDFYVLRVKDMSTFRRIDKILNSEPLDTIMEDELVDGGEQGRVADEEGGFDDETREKYSNNENGVEHETRSDVKEGDSGASPAICGEVVANKGDMGKAPLGEDFEGQDMGDMGRAPLGEDLEGQEGSSSSQGLNFRPGSVFVGINPGTQRRARITILPQLCASPDMVTVRFLDLGNTATLRKDEISPRPASLKSSRPLALRCALFDCWSPGGLKRREAFAELVKCRPLHLEEMGFKNGVKQVDLCFSEGGKMVSVRDLMVFLDHAKFSAPLCMPEQRLADVESREFKQLPRLKKGQVYRALVSHVDKKQVYVHLLSRRAGKLTLLLPDLMDQMGETYKVRKCEEMWSLGTDRPGTPCAVKDVDGLWYRARIEKVLRVRIVRVTFVDFGSSVVVSLHKLRRLFPKFLLLPAIAVPVTLELMSGCVRSAAEVRSLLGHQEVDLEVVGDDREVKISIDDFILNNWMVENDQWVPI